MVITDWGMYMFARSTVSLHRDACMGKVVQDATPEYCKNTMRDLGEKTFLRPFR